MTIAISSIYELWDTETGNLIVDFAEERDAIQAVREGIREEGVTAWEPVALVRVAPDGKRITVAQGAELLAHIAGDNVDPARVQAALMMVDALGSPAFRQAMADLRVALVQIFSEVSVEAKDIEMVRATTAILEKAAGVPVRLEADATHLMLITPNKTMAELIAIGAPPNPAKHDVLIRAVSGGFAVEIAA